MPWCPGCSFEYNAKRKSCPDCGQVLTNGPGSNKPVEFMEREWYSIRAVTDPGMAERLRDFLETNGYDVAVRNGKCKPKIGNGKISKALTMQILVPEEIAAMAAEFIRNNTDWIHVEEPVYDLHDAHSDLIAEYDDDFYEDDASFYDSRIGFEMLDGHDDIF